MLTMYLHLLSKYQRHDFKSLVYAGGVNLLNKSVLLRDFCPLSPTNVIVYMAWLVATVQQFTDTFLGLTFKRMYSSYIVSCINKDSLRHHVVIFNKIIKHTSQL